MSPKYYLIPNFIRKKKQSLVTCGRGGRLLGFRKSHLSYVQPSQDVSGSLRCIRWLLHSSNCIRSSRFIRH